MKRKIIMMFALLISMTAAIPVWSKGKTIRIEIKGISLKSTIVITDPNIVENFNIWNGPGVTVNGVKVHMNPANQAGAFINWPKGMILDKPEELLYYDVSFYLAHPRTKKEMKHKYRVKYALDPSIKEGFMYLPEPAETNFENGLIYHGIEGNWFYSSAAWEKLIRPLIESTERSNH